MSYTLLHSLRDLKKAAIATPHHYGMDSLESCEAAVKPVIQILAKLPLPNLLKYLHSTTFNIAILMRMAGIKIGRRTAKLQQLQQTSHDIKPNSSKVESAHS